MQAVVGVRLLFMGEHSDRIRDASSNVEQKVRHDRRKMKTDRGCVFVLSSAICALLSNYHFNVLPFQVSISSRVSATGVRSLRPRQRPGKHLLWTTSQESLHMVDKLDILVCARFLSRH